MREEWCTNEPREWRHAPVARNNGQSLVTLAGWRRRQFAPVEGSQYVCDIALGDLDPFPPCPSLILQSASGLLLSCPLIIFHSAPGLFLFCFLLAFQSAPVVIMSNLSVYLSVWSCFCPRFYLSSGTLLCQSFSLLTFWYTTVSVVLSANLSVRSCNVSVLPSIYLSFSLPPPSFCPFFYLPSGCTIFLFLSNTQAIFQSAPVLFRYRLLRTFQTFACFRSPAYISVHSCFCLAFYLDLSFSFRTLLWCG